MRCGAMQSVSMCSIAMRCRAYLFKPRLRNQWGRKLPISKKVIMSKDVKTFQVSIKGASPFIMHNSEGANPLNRWTIEGALIKKKGTKKTESDIQKLDEISFLSSLYWSHDLDGLYLPTDNLRKMILEAGRAVDQKGAKKQMAGIRFNEYLGYKFLTENRSDINLLKSDLTKRYFKIVTIARSKVPSIRAIFKSWAIDFEIVIDTSIINPKTVENWLEYSGDRIGLGCRRPYAPTPGEYGRFILTAFKELK